MSNLIVGVDFGTTASCVSFYNTSKKEVEVLHDNNGLYTYPTTIYFESENVVYFGNNIPQNQINSKNYISNIKRLIGVSYEEYNSNEELKKSFDRNEIVIYSEVSLQIGFKINNKIYSVEELVKLYLNYLKNIIIEKFPDKNTSNINSCITVPCYFNDNQREIIKKCYENIGFNVIRILNEPTSAALAYGFNLKSENETCEKYVLIIDCGGGTTDISLLLLDLSLDIYTVKSTAGDNFLGGEDITNEMTNYIINYCKKKVQEFEITPKILNKIKKEAENAKQLLSYNTSVKIYLELPSNENPVIINISQSIFIEEICKDFFRKIRNLIYYSLDSYISTNNKFNFNMIKSIIFIGGSTKIPYFKTLLFKMFGENTVLTINNSIDPDKTVSVGASIQGALLLNQIDSENNILLLDVIPLSIGIETIGGIMTPIISKNTIIPIMKTQEFTNTSDYDDTIIINIYQGERKFVKDNLLLTSFTLKNELFKKFKKGKIIISLTLEIDNDSIITAKAIAKIDKLLLKCSEIKITKECKENFDINNHIEISDNNKLIDNELAIKTLLKIELNDSFKNILSIFHQRRDNIILKGSFIESELNTLFNKVYEIIENFEKYSEQELKDAKIDFEKQWHQIIFADQIIIQDSDGLIIDISGGTTII